MACSRQGGAKLSDIAPVFNLIQDGSKCGFFNNIYLQPRYQAGLAIQLFSVFLFGTIRLPSEMRYKATLRVIRNENAFVGFALTRYLSPRGESREIYMLAISPEYRGNGFGRRLIQSLIYDVECNGTIEAECLPGALPMKRLLQKMGFEFTKPAALNSRKNVAKFKYTRKPETSKDNRQAPLAIPST